IYMLVLQRQRDVECAALAFAALSPDIAAMTGHKLTTKIQPEAKPLAPALTSPRIALKQTAELFFGDTATLIMHRDQRHQGLAIVVGANCGIGSVARSDYTSRLNTDPYRHTCIRRTVADRVANQVGQHLPDTQRIADGEQLGLVALQRQD